MPFTSGAHLGPYEILSPLGAGGMGEVYRARDAKLEREVAIKVLPDIFARDRERAARFEREAKLLASLNHPNIAAIYGFEEHRLETAVTHFLVLELVEGKTLAERIRAGPLPVEEALDVCRQIAEALEAAHEHGVIHRDLKPGNVKVTPEGKVKVLDFGLAKAFGGDVSATDIAHSPTITAEHTAKGVVLGTAAYMSPEQARGKPLDKRTDIWSFGCVLYECLTGRRPFLGETTSDTIAKILEAEPDYERLPHNTPPAIRNLLHHCLEKDRKRRLRDIGDARLELEEAISARAWSTTSMQAVAGIPRHRRGAWIATVGLVCFAIGALAGAIWLSRAKPPRVIEPQPVTCLSLVMPPRVQLQSFDVSPDGRTLVYAAEERRTDDPTPQRSRLFVRQLGEYDARLIEGSEGVGTPVFSPSGRWVAFQASERPDQNLLKRVALDGSPPITIRDTSADAARSYGWVSDDALLLAVDGGRSLARVSVDDGTLERYDSFKLSEGEAQVTDIRTLADGGEILVSVWGVSLGRAKNKVYRFSPDSGEQTVLLADGHLPRYAPTGHLVFVHDEALLAVPFDPTTMKTTGRVIPLMSGVQAFSLSTVGQLTYLPKTGSERTRRLVVVGETGQIERLMPSQKPFQASIRVSPDGRRIAAVTWDLHSVPRVWVLGSETDLVEPMTPRGQPCFAPVWSPDGERLAYFGWGTVEHKIMVIPVDGTGDGTVVLTADAKESWIVPTDWSPDGEMLLVWRGDPGRTNEDVALVSIESGEEIPLVATAARESMGVFSPDGNLIAYVSDASGQLQLYVQEYDASSRRLGAKRQVSTGGLGQSRFWSHDGKAVYYEDQSERLMAVSVETEPALSVSAPRVLFDLRELNIAGRWQRIDQMPDGKGFVYVQKGEGEQDTTHLNVVLNWFEELKRRVPTGKK